MEEKVKKPIYKRWWFWAIAIVVVIALASGGDDAPDTSIPTSSQTGQVGQSEPAAQPEPPKEATWQEVITFEGSSIKDTETFTVSAKEWRINWSTQPGQYGDMNFQIMIYDENGALEGLAANIIGAGSDVSYMRGAGDYYLTINTGQPYKIVIEQKI